ncbi:Protein mlp1 [Elasticomyces elasticus]|nr:Protein mlp1 [Elasticomyces elasticus]
MARTSIDTAYIAVSYGVDEHSIQTLLDAPTTELVKDFLSSLTTKAKEFDETKAEKLRVEVELENTIRSGESRIKGLRATVNKGLQESQELRRKLSEEEHTRSSLESELETLKSSSTNSTSEVQALQSRISVLEASNREALALVDSKSSAYDRIAEELSTQHQKILALRREVSVLEEKNQAAENAASSTRFREQALQQEVDLLKRNNEWHETELKTRAAEYAKFRKEKNARVAELQRSSDDANSTIDAMNRTENILRQRLSEVEQKADDAFARLQQYQEVTSKAEESFKIELDSVRRLAELQKQSAHTARVRLQELQDALEQTNDNARDEISQLQAEIETERSDKEMAERRIAELELEVERLETSSAAQQNHTSIPGTPSRRVNGYTSNVTPGRPGSPAVFSPATSRMKGNLSFTQLYTEHVETKTALESERRRNQKLTATIDEMIQSMESKQPEMEELREEHDRLAAEIVEISSMLDAANADRDDARKEAWKFESLVSGLEKERATQEQQLRDLSAQINVLMMEARARDQGLDALSNAEQALFERYIRGELKEDELAGMTDTGGYISQRLVIFRNVAELQEQNVTLLKLTRQLGEQMEGEEAQAKENRQKQLLEELEACRRELQQHKDELTSITTQAQSYIRERDMFRRMLTHRGQIPPDADAQSMFGQSADGRATPSSPRPSGLSQSMEQTPHSKDLADYAKLLKELQVHFDTYRAETATDNTSLKQQVDRLAREKGDLQGEFARSSSQLTLASERYEMLQANYGMLKNENAEFQKRLHVLADSATKQDLRTQQVAEELVEAKALADSMRNEMANLKAERELWKKIEARLTEDNRTLMDERSRLNKMIGDLQNLQNERELADSESRRRLQGRVDSLESELESAKRKLEAETEESKKIVLRREYDQDQSRTRIDDLMKALSNVREELVAAKTTRDQLQARVDEMKIELRGAEERMQALQPQPTARTGSNDRNEEETVGGESTSSREQDLALEVSDLKRDLELTRGELESAKVQVEQYKAISQSCEEELQSLNETNDQYREETDRIISEKENTISDLKQRTEDLSSELSTTNSELSEIRSKHEESSSRLAEQKASLDTEIARLRNESERHADIVKLYQEDLKAQAEIAQAAQRSYDDEIVKHGEAVQKLQSVREEYNHLRTEVAEIKAEAESAKTSLAQGEEHWAELKERYEREMIDLKARREDVDAQNKILHQQLENVSSQIAALQNKRTLTSEEQADGNPSLAVQDYSQDLITFLRREKEISEVQASLADQESRRLTQQLDHCQSQLDETRQKLNEERRGQVDREANAISQNQLLDKINELNTLREANVTLRNESRQATASAAEKSKEVENLTSQIQPLETRVREIENELETKAEELKLLQADRDHWRQRTQDIISKYDRVDPAELEALKTRIVDLEKERDDIAAKIQPLQEEVDGIPEQIRKVREDDAKTHTEAKGKIIDQAKQRNRENKVKLDQANAQMLAATAEKDRTAEELDALKRELESVKAVRDEAVAKAIAAAQPQMQNPQHERNATDDDTEEGQVDEGDSTVNFNEERTVLENRAAQAEGRAAQESSKVLSLMAEVASLQARVQELESQVVNHPSPRALAHCLHLMQNYLQQQLEASSNEISRLKAQNGGPEDQIQHAEQGPDTAHLELLEKLTQDLAAAQQEVETLRVSSTSSNEALGRSEGEEAAGKSIADQVQEQVLALRTQLEEQHQLSKKQLDERFEHRSQALKNQLNTKMREYKANVALVEARQELQVEHSEAMQQLRTEHEQAIERLKGEHRLEIERLTKTGAVAVEKAAVSEQPTASTDPDSPNSQTSLSGAPDENFKIEGLPELTSEQLIHLLAVHPTAKGILTRNVKSKMEKESEKLMKEIKDTQEKAEKDVKMETMRQSAKLGMAQGQMRQAKAKLEVVEKAANETPQRPVVEVWEIAKVTKAPPMVPAQAPAQATMPAPVTTNVQATPSQPTPRRQSTTDQPNQGQPQQSPAQGGSFGKPSFVPSQQAQQVHVQSSPTMGRALPGPATQVNPADQQPFSNLPGHGVSQLPARPSSTVPPNIAGTQQAIQNTESLDNAQTQLQARPSSRVQSPTAPAQQPAQGQWQQYNQPPGGTAVNALRAAVGLPGSTGIPRPGGGIPRGGGVFRGRGGNGGNQGQQQFQQQNVQAQGLNIQGASQQLQGVRGGLTGIPGARGGNPGWGRGQQGRGGAPGGPALQQQGGSPFHGNARQFIPGGSKRPHDGGGDDGAGKRMRGGHGGF